MKNRFIDENKNLSGAAKILRWIATDEPQDGESIEVAQSAVDDELIELAGFGESTIFPTGHIGKYNITVVPDFRTVRKSAPK